MVADKRIAEWLSISLPTFYRWRKCRLLTRRPRSVDEAKEMLVRIAAARDSAAFARPNGRFGRTRLDAIAEFLGDPQ